MIKIATTSHCPKCMMIKTILKNKKIPYEELDGRMIADELINDGVNSLPAIKFEEGWESLNNDILRKINNL